MNIFLVRHFSSFEDVKRRVEGTRLLLGGRPMRWTAMLAGALCCLGAGCGGKSSQCTEGAVECQGTQVWVCSGGAWGYTQSCSASQTCTNGACVDNSVCTENSTECQ